MEEYQKRKKFPSQIKYEQNNPTITIRLKKYEKEKIEGMAKKAGMSISRLVKISLLNLEEKDFSVAIQKAKEEGIQEGKNIGYQQGLSEGYKKGSYDWSIGCYCWKCGKWFAIKPNSKDHNYIVDEMKGRATCPECQKK